MFNYVVVFADCGVEIHKCENMPQVESIIIDKLREDHMYDVIDAYLEYIKNDVECDWYTEPMSVADYIKDVVIPDRELLDDYEIYWE